VRKFHTEENFPEYGGKEVNTVARKTKTSPSETGKMFWSQNSFMQFSLNVKKYRTCDK
jgi:hypothetical protein